jgi:hypothetical protein
MELSKHFIAIQEGNLSIRVMDSKFEREVGFILNFDGVKFKVAKLFKSRSDAGCYMASFQPHLFTFYNYNTIKNK